MRLLLHIAELFVLYLIVRAILSQFLTKKGKKGTNRTSNIYKKRFDEKNCDISDADYEEIRK
jgi:hypothetical protein